MLGQQSQQVEYRQPRIKLFHNARAFYRFLWGFGGPYQEKSGNGGPGPVCVHVFLSGCHLDPFKTWMRRATMGKT